MEIVEQLKLAAQSRHTEVLHRIYALSGKIPVDAADFDFALNCSEQELRMVAVAAHAKLRWVDESPAERELCPQCAEAAGSIGE